MSLLQVVLIGSDFRNYGFFRLLMSFKLVHKHHIFGAYESSQLVQLW